MDISSLIWQIKEVTLKRPYLYSFLLIVVAYLGFNIYINQFTEVIPVLLSFNLWFVIPYVLLTFLIGILIAINLNLMFFKLKTVMTVKAEGSMTAVGIFGGLLGGACPGCFVGMLPAVAGAFGVTLSLGALPFNGFEIQVPTAAILLLTTVFLTRKNVCKIPKPK